jgi:hypothetical protein
MGFVFLNDNFINCNMKKLMLIFAFCLAVFTATKAQKIPTAEELAKKNIEEIDKRLKLSSTQRSVVYNYVFDLAKEQLALYKKQQAGHFASRRHYSTRWNEYNVQVQCYSCNIGMQGLQFEFGKRLNIQYGNNFAEDLLIESKKAVKFTDLDLKDMIEQYKDKLKEFS